MRPVWLPGCGQQRFGQQALTWHEVRERFEATNPTLRAARIGIDESKAQEITAYLRPNPEVTTTLDQLDPFTPNPYRPLGNALPLVSASYLHEREHKRELRLESARKGTAIAASQLDDQERTLLFNLRNAFVQTLQAKAVLDVAQENLAYYDRVLAVNRDRLQRRRYRAGGSGPAGTAAGAVRIRRADRGGESADRQDPAPDAAERPHAGGAIRRDRAVRFRRAA